MTTIDALTISGIRSFSPNNPQTIRFFKPLTIILGCNGAGKTTIIECLKNVTTGELPPNANKGQSFVHDPKVLGETEVKAQIRLRFKRANGRTTIAIRSYQLTQKEKKAEFKAIESVVVTRDEKGEERSNSSRCAEMNKLVPDLLGVSSPILENVVFCHQEDVNWPLSDPATLKKKFDDIFASSRYTKALDTLRKLKKQQSDELKTYQTELGALEEQTKHAKKLKSDVTAEKFKVDHLTTQIKEMDEKIKEYDVVIGKFDRVADTVQKHQLQTRELEGQRIGLKKIVAEMEAALSQTYSETDEEMLIFQQEFNSKLRNMQKEQKDSEQRLTISQNDKDTVTREITILQAKIHFLDEEKRNYERKLREVCDQVLVLASKNNITGFDKLPFNEQKIFDFVSLFASKINTITREFDEMKKLHRGEESKLFEELNKASTQSKNIKGNMQQLETKLASKRSEANKTKNTLEAFSVTQTEIQELQLVATVKEQEYQRAKSFDSSSISKSIDQIQLEIRKTNTIISNAAKVMKAREDERLLSFQIQHIKDEEKKAQEQIDDKYNSTREKLTILLEQKTSVEELEQKYKQLIVSKRSATEQATREYQTAERAVALQKNKIDSYSSDIGKQEEKATRLENKIRQACPFDKPIHQLLKEAEEKQAELVQETSMIESLHLCYENFVKHANEHKECYVCERGLNDNELPKFVGLQHERLQQAPAHLQKKQEKLKKTKELCDRLRGLIPLQQEAESIRKKDIPVLEAAKRSLLQENQVLAEKLDEKSEEVAALRQAEEEIARFQPDVEQISRLVATLKSIQVRIKREEEKMSRITQKAERPFEEIKKEHELAVKQLEELNRNLDTIRKEQETKQMLVIQLNQTWSKAKDELHAKNTVFERKQRYQADLDRLNKEMQEIHTELIELQNKAPTLKSELDAVEMQHRKMKSEHDIKEQSMQHQLNNSNADYSRIQTTARDIKRYLEENKEEALSHAQDLLAKINIRQSKITMDIEKLKSDLKTNAEKIENYVNITGNIEANLQLRKKMKELRQLEEQIAEVESQLNKETGSGKVNIVEIEEKRSKKKTEESNKNKALGSLSTHKDNLAKYEKEFNSGKYKDSENQHRATLIKHTALEAASNDLDKYSKALERALIKYHSMKITEINEIMKELWHKTYRGQDIDSIEIRADNDGSAKRSYNYRVVMKKGDVVLDMRGRCSAGQKVLASIIIRLALAEAFCIDCGILALDEPTTNLDYDNVQSLAEALQVIIQERRKQVNFQLLVITHDEEFVQKLGRSDFVDHYYRVSKDPTTQCSIIEKQPFQENAK